MHRRTFLQTAAVGAAGQILLSSSQRSVAAQPAATDDRFRSRIIPVSDAERAARIERARALMHEAGIDALVMEGGVSLRYFTGVRWGRSERLFAMVLPRSGEPAYLSPKFEEGRAREQTGNANILTWEEDEDPYLLIRDFLTGRSLATGTIGIEETVRSFIPERIALALPNARLVSGTPVTAGCRSVKTAHELELMQVANDITAIVFSSALTSLHEEMTEPELADIISRRYADFGVDGGALVLFGEASAFPHGLVRTHTLKKDQIVLIDGGCTVEDYNSDVTRTTVFGTPDDAGRKVWEIVRTAQTAALKAAKKPGVPAEEIDKAARTVVADAGYGPGYRYFSHRLGHGIGMDGHEWYYLVNGNKRPVESGNVFSNEPGIYQPGRFGIRLEDEIVITGDGARLMLPQAKDLLTIF